MGSIVDKLTSQGLIIPPTFLKNNIHYECMVGSIAYGVSSDNSDIDVYGFVIPPKDIIFPHLAGEIQGFGMQKERFEQFQTEESVISKDGRTKYDLAIYNIVKFFQLCMNNNPNIIDSLFVPRRCITHITQTGEHVRENRKLFLHKGAWHSFKGYAYGQMHKMNTKNPEGKRKEIVEKYGYDCYLDSETEFLTEKGWRKFDDVSSKLATLNNNGEVEFQEPITKIEKQYSGNLYVLEPYMSRCIVTEKHNMLVSIAHRGKRGYQYDESDSNWRLVDFDSLLNSNRSWFHVRTSASPRTIEYDVSDEYLLLSGLFVSEGSINFRNNKTGKVVKNARLTQTENGKDEFFREVRALSNIFDIKEYTYDKETVWTINRDTAINLYNDFGHGCKENLRLPDWCFKLSHRQAMILWRGLFLGDGSLSPNGAVVYTSNENLANDYQAMMISSGHSCSKRGPFTHKSGFGDNPISYQVYLSKEKPYRCVDFNRGIRFLAHDQDREKRGGYTIKEHKVIDKRVVCFEVPNGTLVTRSNGKAAFHGNCKFAYHVVRLLNEIEQILTEHDLDLERNREQLKSIRRGEWKQSQIVEYFEMKEKDLEWRYTKSKLQHSPDEEAIKALLLECLEMHYGSLEKAIFKPFDEKQLLKDLEILVNTYS